MKTTTVAVVPSCKYTMPSAVRQFQHSDIQIKEDWILGRGRLIKRNTMPSKRKQEATMAKNKKATTGQETIIMNNL